MSWAQGEITNLHPLIDLVGHWASEGSFPGAASYGEDLPSCIASPPENILVFNMALRSFWKAWSGHLLM